MNSSKFFIQVLSKARRGLHLSANSTILENSCWELRKEARKSNTKAHYQSLDRQFYQPRPIEQRACSRTWLKRLDEDEPPLMSNMSGGKPNLASTIEERMDRSHYNPMTLRERTYERTWNEYEEGMDSVSTPPQTHIPDHPPVRKRCSKLNNNVNYQKTKPQKRTSPKPYEYNHRGLDLGAFSLECSTFY